MTRTELLAILALCPSGEFAAEVYAPGGRRGSMRIYYRRDGEPEMEVTWR